MANPPFNLDITDPADNATVSQFPANERTFRDNTNSYLNTEHDISTGYHKFQTLTTTQKSALVNPPTGMMVYDTTLGLLQINTGTSASPVWTTIGPSASTGDIKMWPTTTAPTGWLNCDGTAISRTTYAALFALIGTTFGAGDGVTTFNLPNFQRRVPVGFGGTGSSTLGNAIGNTGGEESHTLSTTEIPSHTHSVTDPGHSHSFSNSVLTGNSGSTPGGGNPIINFITGTLSAVTGISLGNTGGGAAHNIIQPSLIVNFVIKT